MSRRGLVQKTLLAIFMYASEQLPMLIHSLSSNQVDLMGIFSSSFTKPSMELP